MNNVSPPPLAQFKPLDQYSPKYGDMVVWSKWFTTWHGFIINADKDDGTISVVFAGLPYLLLTMDSSDFDGETKIIKLKDIRQAPHGKFAIQTIESGQAIWYI